MSSNFIIENSSLIYEKVETVSKDITLKVKSEQNEYYLHSIVDPKNQGLVFAQNNYSDRSDLVLYGLGLGYHVVALYKLLKKDQKLYILECNEIIAEYAMQFEEVRNILKDSRVICTVTSNKEKVISFFNDAPRSAKLIYYYPCVKTIPQNLEFLREKIIDLRFESNISGDQLMMNNNHRMNNKKYKDFLDDYNGELVGAPCVISVSGPSLVNHQDEVEEYKKRSFFVSSGRNNIYFNEIGFEPDIYIEVDSGDIPVQRFKHFDSDVLLLFVSTVMPELGRVYNGPKAQIIIGDQNNNIMMMGGGSTVASTAIELAIVLGCNPIVLIGQDLCYIEGNSHFDHQESSRVSAPQVLCNDGKHRKTNEAFLKHKRSIEKLIAMKGSNINFYSISNKGALINGVNYIDSNQMLSILDKIKYDKKSTKYFINTFKSK